MYMMAKNRPFEVIFVSSDKSRKEFEVLNSLTATYQSALPGSL